MHAPQQGIFRILQQLYTDFCIDIVRQANIDFNVEKSVPCNDMMIHLPPEETVKRG
jgi:hypothetical protein